MSMATPGNRERGFLKVYRSAFDDGDPFWGEKRARTAWEARFDLLRMAHYEAKLSHVTVAGRVIDVKRGQVLTSILGLAESWRWSRGKVRRFIARLVALGTIKVESGLGMNEIRTADGHPDGHRNGQDGAAPFLLLTFCNFEHYNSAPGQGAQKNGQPHGHRDETKTDTGRTHPIKRRKKNAGGAADGPPPEDGNGRGAGDAGRGWDLDRYPLYRGKP